MPQTHKSILGLDVGARRVGLAIASLETKFASPLRTLEQGDQFWSQLQSIIEQEDVAEIVIGLPRGMSGQQTSQTDETEAFVSELKDRIELPVYLQDEALTSSKAKQELEARGKPYAKGDVDALAATYILDDYLKENVGRQA